MGNVERVISLSSFRPLSWGLSFNGNIERVIELAKAVFVPFLGDFLSIRGKRVFHRKWKVFVPFLGDFLSIIKLQKIARALCGFSSPFLGTFFQYCKIRGYILPRVEEFSSPFLGTFFQSETANEIFDDCAFEFSSPFLGTFFQLHGGI